MTLVSWLRGSAQGWLDKMFLPQLFVKSNAFIFVLGSKRAAANQIARAAALCVFGDASPEHVQDVSIPIVLMHAGPPELENFSANLFEGRKVEELLAVIAEVAFGAIAALHAVSADKATGGDLTDH